MTENEIKVINKQDFIQIYPMIDEKCETCGSELEVFESKMLKTHLTTAFYKMTAKRCPKCWMTIK